METLFFLTNLRFVEISRSSEVVEPATLLADRFVLCLAKV
jgi:hypothetical protein